MTANKTTLTPETAKDMPPRGKGFKAKLLDAIRKQSMLELEEGATREQAEEAFMNHLATRAFDKDGDSILLRELINKSYPSLKSALPEYKFLLPNDATTPAMKAEAVFKAVADGHIPPDVGNLLIQAAKGMIDIEVGTELKERIEKLEVMLSERL